MNLSDLKSIFSLSYNDRPMSDAIYEANGKWFRFFNDYYFRVEHHGFFQEAVELAKSEHILLISNHAILVEACAINYALLRNDAGYVGSLVYREAFKIPLFREFFRSSHCAPASVDNGVAILKKRHLLIFPEGLDFVGSYINPDRVPAFHKGFLRIAKRYLRESGKKHLYVIPIGHAGLEQALKLWVIKNEFILQKFVRPIVNFPHLVFPKLPFLWPAKVIFYWGMPVKIASRDLSNEKKISKKMNEFRSALLHQKQRAQEDRDTARI